MDNIGPEYDDIMRRPKNMTPKCLTTKIKLNLGTAHYKKLRNWTSYF